jgi:Arc/MetJ-type ribon-helix-helix transcriptional regulator
MSLQVPPDVIAALSSHVERGAFPSTEDALRAAVKLLDTESVRQRKLNELRESLREADEQINRGEFYDADEVFDALEMELFGKKLGQP